MAERDRVRNQKRDEFLVRPFVALAMPHHLPLFPLSSLYRFRCALLRIRTPTSSSSCFFLTLTLPDVHYSHHVCEYARIPFAAQIPWLRVVFAYHLTLDYRVVYGMLTCITVFLGSRDTRLVSLALSLTFGTDALNLRLLQLVTTSSISTRLSKPMFCEACTW